MYSTTLDRIVALSEAEQLLLSRDTLTAAERRQFQEIRADLAQLWPARRAELAFAHHGPPRMVSAPDPRSQRQVARGIAPLPNGRG